VKPSCEVMATPVFGSTFLQRHGRSGGAVCMNSHLCTLPLRTTNEAAIMIGRTILEERNLCRQTMGNCEVSLARAGIE
jgi:hypothetical protein